MLRAAGYEVECAFDAHEGLRKLGAEAFDVLVADREMPGNDRLAIVRDMPPSCAGMPVVLVTAYPTVDSAIQALQLPVVAYIVKPVEKDELLGHVGTAIEMRRTFRLVGESRARLAAWSAEIGQLEKAMQICPGEIADSARDALLSINLDHLKSELVELRQGLETGGGEGGVRPASGSAVPFGLRAHEQIALLQGLRETIDVLEKTKRSFKSRELGQLRKRLEGLFEKGPSAE